MIDDDRHLSYDLTKSNSVHNGIVALQVHTGYKHFPFEINIDKRFEKRVFTYTRAHGENDTTLFARQAGCRL